MPQKHHKKGPPKRLSRDKWLSKALDVLSEDPTHLRIDQIAHQLGVSKGSFYWHFENREDFVQALAEYWEQVDTQIVADVVAEHGGTPEERLYVLMKFIAENRPARYDLAVRAWSRIEPSIVPIVREVDAIRLNVAHGLFEEMGFSEPELTVRARAFVICHSFDQAFTIEQNRDEALEQLDARYAFFARR